jgi:2-phospho-L-lactate guanylyltransferase
VTVSAVVPAKTFARAKSRLSGALDAASRAELARSMLGHVLGVLSASPAIDDIVVVTDGDDVEAVGRARGARCIRDRGEPPLRLAVDLGLEAVRRDTSGVALVLMADLPWVTVEEIGRMLARLREADVLVSPDAKRTGTNALALAAHARMQSAFGSTRSFARHVATAGALGLRVGIHRSPGIAFDVDTPADLAVLGALNGETPIARPSGTGTVRRA